MKLNLKLGGVINQINLQGKGTSDYREILTTYIWLGTCDLTGYDGTFVRLSTDENIVNSLLDKYKKT